MNGKYVFNGQSIIAWIKRLQKPYDSSHLNPYRRNQSINFFSKMFSEKSHKNSVIDKGRYINVPVSGSGPIMSIM